MKATATKLLDFLKKSPQFIIPIYQRTYSWTESQCEQLWEDILRTGRNDHVPAHFVGSIVYIEQGLYTVTTQSQLLVIDGQQRLTTVTLILEALARHISSEDRLAGFSAKKLRNYYLLNPEEDGELGYKLILTQNDKSTLLALVDQKPPPTKHSVRVQENFELFLDKIDKLGDVTDLWQGLAKLVVVDVALDRKLDNPQLIFESMNSTGKELSQADLIRNYVLMGLPPQQQTELYNDHWRPMEVAFGQEAYGEFFDAFMRNYLTVKTGEIPKLKNVYEAFRLHANRREVVEAGVEAMVADIHTFADYYCEMVLRPEGKTKVGKALSDLRALKVDVAYPFLLEVYHDFKEGLLSEDEMEKVVRLVESYAFRRAVCNIPTNSMNKTFGTFHRSLDKTNYLESILAQFLLLPSYRRFPRDEEFRREIQVRDLYNFRSRSFWLRRLENFERKEQVHVADYTIEHIMPQKDQLTPQWCESLGPEWERIQEEYLHTLGNLTLTGYNSEYGAKSFAEKRDMKGGFKQSPLKVNEGLGVLDDWNESTIRERADRLAKIAQQVWISPKLPEETLDAYRPKKRVTKSHYTIEDQKGLSDGSVMRPLFDKLRQEILSLDDCVNEEFLKYYVAYKAETNFVDVVVRRKRLRLSLNMKFHEIEDSKGIAVDLKGKKRWGNGDVHVFLSTEDEIPYALGLIRQALEKQLENNGD